MSDGDIGVSVPMPDRDWFTREAVTGGMPTVPSPVPRDEARETLIRALLSDVTQSHAAPESADYNECDKAPCAWCEDAFRVMAAAPRADQTISLAVARSAVEAAQEVIGQCDCIMSSDGQDDPKRLWREARDRFRAAARAPGRTE